MQTYARLQRSVFPGRPARILGPALLAALLALAVMLFLSRPVSAAGSDAGPVIQTVETLVSHQPALQGMQVGQPLAVYATKTGAISYYLVPLTRAGQTAALVGIGPDGKSWQWFNQHPDPAAVPSFDSARAAQTLGMAPGQRPVLVTGGDGRLYWAASARSTSVLATQKTYDSRSVASISSVSGAVPDVKLGSAAAREAADPATRAAQLTTQSLPQSKTLSVPYYQQVTNYFCGPATLQMLFGYYGPRIASQYDIAHVANATNWGSWRGAYADDVLRAARFSSLSQAVMDGSLQGFKERSLGYGGVSDFWSSGGSSDPDYATRYTDLKTLISAGYPVLMLTWYDGSQSVGHFRVLIGYDDSSNVFIVNDPWYSAPYYGPNIQFNQQFLVDNLWTSYDRWAMIMPPWNVSVAAPSVVTTGTPFTVSATISYRGPHPFDGRGAVSNSQATITLPAGFTVDKQSASLPAITMSGTEQTVTWTVTAPVGYTGSANFNVVAKGLLSGSSSSYNSYQDWIGGTGTASTRVDAPPSVVSVSPSSATTVRDQFTTFSATYSDPDGASDLRTLMLLVNSQASGDGALYGAYSTVTHNVYLRKADNSDWLPPAIIGTNTILDNGMMRIDVAHTTLTQSGNQITINWAVSEESTHGQTQNVYLQAQDMAADVTDWVAKGSWLVNTPPTPVSVSGTSGIVSPRTPVAITSTYQDLDGVADIQTGQLLINSSLQGAGAVWLKYDAQHNALYLRNNLNTGWLGPVTPGSIQQLNNGRAVLSAANTVVTRSGNNLTVRWGLQFSTAFSGYTYKVYSVASDSQTGSALPWQQLGVCTISSVPQPLASTPVAGVSAPSQLSVYSIQYRDQDGARKLAVADLKLAPPPGRSPVWARYSIGENKLYLRNDSDSAWVGATRPGSTSNLANTSVILDASATSVYFGADTLTVRWAIRYLPAASGQMFHLYGSADDLAGVSSGWTQVGQWVVNRPPLAWKVTPGQGSSVVGGLIGFNTTYSDPDGAANLSRVTFNVNTSESGWHGLLARYDVTTGQIWMKNPEGSGWLGPYSPGQHVTATTSYATLDLAHTTVSRSSSTVSVKWAVKFGAGMKGKSLKQYVTARDAFGAQSDREVGTWQVR